MSEGQSERVPTTPANRWLPFLYLAIVLAYGAWMSSHVSGHAKPAVTDAQQPKDASGDDALIAMTQDAQILQSGAETYKTTCATCHGAEGQGLVGPNLTDAFWLHGAKAAEIRRSIAYGVIEKGMPGWELSLGSDRVDALTAYVLTMKGKNVPGKPPQGERIE